MPNGPGFTENEWSRWRGEVSSMLHSGQEWMHRHQETEFAYHDRVEQHMQEAKSFIALSAQYRLDLDKRVGELEKETGSMIRDVESMKTRLTIIFTTIIPVAMWAAAQVFEFIMSRVR